MKLDVAPMNGTPSVFSAVLRLVFLHRTFKLIPNVVSQLRSARPSLSSTSWFTSISVACLKYIPQTKVTSSQGGEYEMTWRLVCEEVIWIVMCIGALPEILTNLKTGPCFHREEKPRAFFSYFCRMTLFVSGVPRLLVCESWSQYLCCFKVEDWKCIYPLPMWKDVGGCQHNDQMEIKITFKLVLPDWTTQREQRRYICSHLTLNI